MKCQGAQAGEDGRSTPPLDGQDGNAAGEDAAVDEAPGRIDGRAAVGAVTGDGSPFAGRRLVGELAQARLQGLLVLLQRLVGQGKRLVGTVVQRPGVVSPGQRLQVGARCVLSQQEPPSEDRALVAS